MIMSITSIINIILIGIMVSMIAGFICGIYLEIKDYNKGVCPRCGNKLELFDRDSQGGRGYVCRHCYFHTWVSWWFVDKNKK